MAIGNITFVKGKGGLGRPLTGEDYISAISFYTANGNLPTGFSTSARIKKVFSVADAVALGIKNDYSDATASTATYLVTAVGSNGSIIKVTCDILTTSGVVTKTLCNYTKLSGDSTVTILGASLATAINAGTYSHGFTASASTGTVTITAPKSQGIYLNSGTPYVVTITGSTTGTLTQNVVTGVASLQAVWHYHISEYFRLQPKGVLFISFNPIGYTFTDITTTQNFADGKVRQLGVYLGGDSHAYTSGDLTTINTEVVANCDGNHKPLSVIYSANIKATSDLTTLTDLNTLTANKCSVVVSQDGAGLGNFLYNVCGYSIGNVGACLGAVSASSVSDSIEWVGKFNISNGVECDTPAFGNGDLFSAKSASYLDSLDALKYIFLVKYVGNAGSYFTHSYTAIVSTSDYSRIEGNRTIDKAIRGVYSSVLPALGSPLVLNSDGTLTDTTIAYFTSLAEVNLIQMIRDVELSAMAVVIDSTQNVLSTGNLVIAVELLPIGVAESITVNIGFVTSI